MYRTRCFIAVAALGLFVLSASACGSSDEAAESAPSEVLADQSDLPRHSRHLQ